MIRLLLALSFLPFLSAGADADIPVCNPTDEDTVLLQQKSGRDFFAARAARPECGDKYTTAKAQFLNAREGLVKLVSDQAPADQIDRQEAAVEDLRQPYLEATVACGPCATNPIEERDVQIDGKTEFWYKNDGSCQLPSADKAALKQWFDKLVGELTHLSQYPREPGTGKGFNPVMQVAQYDPLTGSFVPGIDLFDGKGSPLFVVVKGPLGSAFSYYINDKYQQFERDGDRQFTMHGEAVAPEGFAPPRLVTYKTASGRTKRALNSLLAPGSATTWYVNEDGYVRYCATANPGFKSEFIENFGRTQMLDLLATCTE